MKRKLLLFGLALLVIWCFRALNSPKIYPSWQKRTWQSLYTQVSLTLKTDSGKTNIVQAELDSIFVKFTKIHQAGSTLDKSIENASVGDTLALEKDIFSIFKFAEDKFQQSKGDVNPAVGNLLRLYGLEWGQKPRLPSKQELLAWSKKNTSLFYKTIPGAIVILQDSIHHTFGAFSKGYAMDLCHKALIKHNIQDFLLEVGGDLIAKGNSPRKTHWSIGIKNPDFKNTMLARVSLANIKWNAIATSGGYENYFTDSLGRKHHHILDPKTQTSVQGKKSLTIISNGAAETDFLATWLFIQPKQKVMDLLNSNPNIEGILIPDSGTIFISDQLKKHYQPI
jgi:thiamine biosynthesis lipoprotein